jgi:hypothetical protein
MSMLPGRKKAIVLSSAVLMAVSGFCTQVSAAPFATAASLQLSVESMIEQVQVRPAGKRRPVPVARARKRNSNAAAAAAIVGIGVLGIAAAAAASQGRPRAGQYYTDQWGNPVDAYGRPIYVERRFQSYQSPGNYQDLTGYDQQPGYHRRPQVSEWERQEIRARERAQRESARQQHWRQQQQVYQPQYRQAPMYRRDPYVYGRGYGQPGASDFRVRQRGIGDSTQDKGQ